MKLRPQSQNDFLVILTAGLGIGLLFAGCKDKVPQVPHTRADSSPRPTVTEATPATSLTHDSDVPTPSPVLSPTIPGKTASTTDPAALAKEFRATDDADKRGELVDAIWSLDTPAAVEMLRQLYLIERDANVKVDIIAGLTDTKKPETREARFGLVLMALAQGQPKDVRELAAQMLVDFDDPRAISLLQQFAQDADPDMREAAKEALETRRAVDQP